MNRDQFPVNKISFFKIGCYLEVNVIVRKWDVSLTCTLWGQGSCATNPTEIIRVIIFEVLSFQLRYYVWCYAGDFRDPNDL